jgi:hypothetical protein
MRRMDDEILHHLLHARSEAKGLVWNKAEEYYLAILGAYQHKLKNDSTDDDTYLEYLDIKAEYLSSTKTARAIESNDLFIARNSALEALNVIHEAKQKDNRQKYGLHFSSSEANMLKTLILRYGCIVPKNEKHYTIKCPILVRKYFRIFSISPTIAYDRVLCSICMQPKIYCIHKTGKKYGDKVAARLYEGGRILDISFVTLPKDSTSSLLVIYIPRSSWEGSLSPEQTKRLAREGMNCHLCTLENIDPKEINYELFDDMQKAKPSSENQKSEEVYVGISFSVPHGIDATTAKGKPVIRFSEGSEYYHIPSSIFSVPPPPNHSFGKVDGEIEPQS